MPQGRVKNVTKHLTGSELKEPAPIEPLFPELTLYPDTDLYPEGVEEIVVVDIDEFDFDGGRLMIGTETLAYTIPEGSTGEITLVDDMVGTYDAEEPVWQVSPFGIERYAHVLGPGQEEPLEVLVPHALYKQLDTGIRAEDEEEEVEFAQVGTALVVTNVIARAPDGLPQKQQETVVWRTDEGVNAAEITSNDVADVEAMNVNAYRKDGFLDATHLYLRAGSETDDTFAEIEVTDDVTRTPQRAIYITVVADDGVTSHRLKLLDGAGDSDFV